jgi:hypothetical protein
MLQNRFGRQRGRSGREEPQGLRALEGWHNEAEAALPPRCWRRGRGSRTRVGLLAKVEAVYLHRRSPTHLGEIVHLHHGVVVKVPVTVFVPVIDVMETALRPPEGEGHLAVVHDLFRLVGVDVSGGPSFGENVQWFGFPVLRRQFMEYRVGGLVPLYRKGQTLGTLAEIIGVENSAAAARVQFRIFLQVINLIILTTVYQYVQKRF